MNSPTRKSRPTMVTLAAMLVLAATASGCGVGLPTQPDLGSPAAASRQATAMGPQAMGDPVVIDDQTIGGGGIDSVPVPVGEGIVPTPSTGRTSPGLAKGHYKNKNKGH